ncbi:MAG: hypothetical protein DMF77_24865 [Acidobacteria bacterium]|nr:MAG: hypothetical protein DMF77_24865 [Acidobacteriota bacterium]
MIVPCALVALALGGAALAAARAPRSAVERLLLAPDPAAAGAALLSPAARALAAAAVLLVVAVILGALKSRRAFAAAAALVVGDLLWTHRGLNPSASASFYRYRPEILRAQTVQPGMRVYAADYVATGGRTPRRALAGAFMDIPPGFQPVVSLALGLQAYLYPPTSARWGVYGSFDRDLLGFTSRGVSELRAALEAAEDTPAYAPLLRLGAVDVVIALHDLEAPFEPAGTFADVARRLPTRAFRVPRPLPRTLAVTRAVARRGSEDVGPFVTGELDPASTVILDSGPLPPGATDGDTPPAHLEGLIERPDHLRASVEAGRPAWFVWVSAYDPGWRATVDGHPAPVLIANHAFMAVGLPAGSHVVELRYRPRSVALGSAASLAGLAIGVALVWKRPR